MKKRWLAILMAFTMSMSLLPMNALATGEGEVDPTPAPTQAIYVSAKGNDETGDGTEGKPYATLAKAAGIVNADETGARFIVNVLSDLTSSACARFYNHDVTIEGNGFTVTRGDEFETQSDTARSWYNPAMIEVQADNSNVKSGLTLKNIILDDAGKHMGTVFAQAISGKNEEDKSNLDYVQDAMVASNATAPCTITLGEGTVLRNFGGMSAVRVTAQAKLVMESGSKIEDVAEVFQNGRQGGYGAVWAQNGTVTMENGSMIHKVIGRAIYLDMSGSEAIIAGTIKGIVPSTKIFEGTKGAAIYLRLHPTATLLDGSVICDITGTNGAVYLYGGTFTMEKGSVIKDLMGSKAIQAEYSVNKETVNGEIVYTPLNDTIYMDGEITGLRTANNETQPININSQTKKSENYTVGKMMITIGPNGTIHDNEVRNGAIYIQAVDGKLDVYGKIEDNHTTSDHKTSAGGIYMAHNLDNCTVTMHPGAKITGNSGAKGGGVLVSKGTFIMEGGVISGNTAFDGTGGGIYIRNHSQFIMNGGTISDNYSKGIGGGICYDATESDTVVELNDGTISGNLMNSNITLDNQTKRYSASGGTSNDLSISEKNFGNTDRYLKISNDMTIGNPNIYFKTDTKTVTPSEDSLNIKLENASAGSNTALSSASTGKGWSAPIATFWTQRNGAADLTVGGLKLSADQQGNTLPVYVLTQKTGADGKPADGAEVKAYAAAVEGGNVRFTLPTADVNGDGCAVAIVQPSQDFGTLTITGPKEIRQRITAEEYPVSYTVTYAVSENMKNILKNSTGNPSYSLTLAPDAKLIGTVVSSFDGTTITVDYTLSSNDFAAGEKLLSSALLTIMVGDQSYTIPSNVAETTLVGLVTVTFDLNGGDGGMTPVQLTKGEALGDAMPANPSRSGYTFTGWNTKADGTGEIFTSATAVNGDLTVYAQWSKNHTGGGNHKPPVLNTEDHYGYIVGYPDGTVQPEGNITRAEVATIFFRLLTDDARTDDWSQTSSYSDVSSSDWFNAAVCTLSKAGILSGYEDGSFHPNGKITRAEFAAIASRFFEYADENIENPFSDVEEGAWYYKYIMAASEMGLINGYPDGTFGPQKSITRAEACAIVNRTLDRHPDQENFLKDMLVWVDNMDTGKWYYEDMQEATNSHEYEMKGSGDNKYENWTKMLPIRDWAAFEKEWSDANSATGGEVVK